MGRKVPDSEERLHYECLAFIQKHLFREKRTRQDVIDKKERNRQTSVTVVKSTLNKFCRVEALSLRTPLDLIIKEVNKATAEAYLLTNLHVMRMCNTGQPIAALDQSFFYGCLSAFSQTKRQKTTIKDCRFCESVELYLSWRLELQDYSP